METGLSGIMPTMDVGGNNNGFLNGEGIWAVIILFALLGGGFNRGGLFGGSSGGGVTDGYVLASDFSNIERKIDTVNAGLCDGFYAMNTGMLNGFSGVNAAIQADTVAGMQNTNAIAAQLNTMAATNSACCCDIQRQIERGFADVGYNMATSDCQTRQTVNDVGRAIMDNCNANHKQVMDFLVNTKIEELTAENQSLKLAASQAAQNTYLLDQLRPAPIPAYAAPNPYAYLYNGCGCNGYQNI